MILPGKPTSKKQQYRPTPKGKASENSFLAVS
jgi:hypothetical protein